MTELLPRRLFQTCTWGCSTISGSGVYAAAALISEQLKKQNPENIEDQVANVFSTS